MTNYTISNPQDKAFCGSGADYELELVQIWNDKIAAKMSEVLLPS